MEKDQRSSNTMGHRFIIRCDVPNLETTETLCSNFEIVGWAISEDDLDKIVVEVDGAEAGLAIYGYPRPDVGKVYPDVAGSARSGYRYLLDITNLSNGKHQLRIQAWDKKGRTKQVSGVFIVDRIGFTQLPTEERMIPDLVKGTPHFFEHISRYAFPRNNIARKRVLDVGCGVGYGSQFMAFQTPQQVVGVDSSLEALEYAQKRYWKKGTLSFASADAETLPFPDESFDLVVAFEIIEHLQRPERCLQEVKRVLAADGLFFVSTPNAVVYKMGDTPNPYHTREFSCKEFRLFLQDYFPYVEIFSQNHFAGQVFKRVGSQAEMELAQVDTSVLEGQAQPLYFLGACAKTESQLADQLLVQSHHNYFWHDEGLATLRADYQAKTSELEHLQKVIQAREEEVARLTGEVERLQEIAKARGAEVAQLQESIQAREAEVAHLAGEVERLQEAAKARQAEVAQLQESVRAREAEGVRLTGEVERLQEVAKAREVEVARLQESVQVREAEGVRLTGEVERLQEVAKAREEETTRLLGRVDEQTEELRQAHLLVSSIEQSASWKLIQRLLHVLEWVLPPNSRRGKLSLLMRGALLVWLDEGLGALIARTFAKGKSGLSRRLRQKRDQHQPLQRGPVNQHDQILLVCDEPNLLAEDVVFGSVLIRGWVLTHSGIDKIEIHVDNQLIGLAKYGGMRPDVAMAHPDFAEAERSGFSFKWDSTSVPDGKHNVLLRAISKDGHTRDLAGHVIVDNATPRKDDYEIWMELYEPRDILEAQEKADTLSYRPLISIIMPVYNTEAPFLERAIESVREQAYPNWELCICNDGSTEPHVRRILNAACRQEPKLKVKHLAANSGITTASNEALSLASGEFIVPMDHDDELPPHALYQVVKRLNAHPEADLIYSDEDKMDVEGRRYEPFFKPDWSPDLFLSCNYLNHLTAIRASLVKEVGGFRPAYEGSQDYDLYLRVIEKTQQIHHIPKILYHWRAVPSSTASGAQVKLPAHMAAQKALTDHLRRQRIEAEVLEGNALGRWRIKYAIQGQPTVAIILPTGGKMPLLEECVRGLQEKTSYRHFELVIVDNSQGEEVQQFFPVINEMFAQARYLDCRYQPFNFSHLNNEGVKSTKAPLVLFLNDDIVLVNPDWLEAMVEHGQRADVGAVGAKLIYADGTIQHAGVVMGVYDNSGHAFKGLPADERESVYFDLPHVIRDCSAVTAACLMTRQEVFWEVGGFEEIRLPVAFQDVDLCLKMGERGYLIVYTPYAKLLHYEAKTKAEKVPHPYEVRYMQQKWAHVIARDPYYNPNLTRKREDFALGLS